MSRSEDDPLHIPTGYDPAEIARTTLWNNIRWRVLFCTLEKNGHKNISDLARISQLSIEETVMALEGYELLGYIKKTPQGYVQLTNTILRKPHNEQTKIQVLQDYLFPNMQVINEMLRNPVDPNHNSKSLVYNSNKELFEELKQNIAQAVSTFKEKSDLAAKWDGVYTLSAAMTLLSKYDET